MNQSTPCTETALPEEPLFASSWAALFRLIQEQFAPRAPAASTGEEARAPTRPH